MNSTNKKALTIAFLIIAIVANGIAQMSSEKQLKIIEKMTRYRDALLLHNPNAVNDLKILFEKWEQIKVSQEEISYLQNAIAHLANTHGLSNEEILNRIKTKYSDLKIFEKSTTADIQTIKENHQLLELIQLGVLASQYPFKLSANNHFISEIEEYNFSEEDKIGEIGAGSGAFSLMVHKIFPSVKISINEVDKNLLQNLKTRIDNDLEITNIEDLHLVVGNSYSTNMEGFELDKIIIRDAFHHFYDKKGMLKSIRKSLHADGELYLLEATKELGLPGKTCAFAMEKNKIIRRVESKGFQLIGQKQMENSVLLKFVLSKEQNKL